MKDGDIYRWEYNKEELKKLNHGHNGGTTYWAKSKIGIWDEKRGVLKDTYWTGGSEGAWFTKEDIVNRLVVTYVANLNDLVEVNRSEFNKYDDEDCVDISHANMTGGGFYIFKNAKQSIDKKRRVFEAHIKHHENESDYHKRTALYLRENLQRLNHGEDVSTPYNREVYV